MSYDQGIDFRATAAFVTDPANCTYDIYNNAYGEGNYPVTTPQGNTVGWENGSGTWNITSRDRESTFDPRLAGCSFTQGVAAAAPYRFDLPTSGDYSIVVAGGDADYSQRVEIELQDGTTSLGTLCSGTPAAGSFYDASGNVWTAAQWPTSNVPYAATFSTTICRFIINPSASATDTFVTHLRVTAAGGNVYLAGSILGVASASGTQKVSLAIAGGIQAIGVLDAAQAVALSLVGNVDAVGSLLATAAVGNALAGTVAAVASSASAIDLAVSLAGALGSVGTLSGSPRNAIALAGGTFAVGTLDGALNGGSAAALAGALGAVATFSGNLTTSVALHGGVASVAANTALVANAVGLAAITQARASVSGGMSVSIALAGALDSTAIYSGTLGTSQSAMLAGVIGAVATIGGTLTNRVAMAGLTGAASWLGGALGVGGRLIPAEHVLVLYDVRRVSFSLDSRRAGLIADQRRTHVQVDE